jgi:hypothetical protein
LAGASISIFFFIIGLLSFRKIRLQSSYKYLGFLEKVSKFILAFFLNI